MRRIVTFVGVTMLLIGGCASPPADPGAPPTPDQVQQQRMFRIGALALNTALAADFLKNDDPEIRQQAAELLARNLNELATLLNLTNNPTISADVIALVGEFTRSGKWDAAEWLRLSEILTKLSAPPPAPSP